MGEIIFSLWNRSRLSLSSGGTCLMVSFCQASKISSHHSYMQQTSTRQEEHSTVIDRVFSTRFTFTCG